jgi:hypothetical protein
VYWITVEKKKNLGSGVRVSNNSSLLLVRYVHKIVFGSQIAASNYLAGDGRIRQRNLSPTIPSALQRKTAIFIIRGVNAAL